MLNLARRLGLSLVRNVRAATVGGLYISTIDGQPLNNNTITNTKPTLTGYVTAAGGSLAGYVIHFKLANGTEDGTAVTDAAGAWTYTYTGDLVPGEYELASLIYSELPNGSEANDSILVDDPIQQIGTWATGSTTVTMPAHQAGDLLIACVFRDGGTVTPPAGWTLLLTNGQSSFQGSIYWKIAASSSEVSGTWTNATDLAIGVYRNANNANPFGGTSTATGSSGTLAKGAVTPVVTDGTSWFLLFAMCRVTTQTPNYSGNWTQRATRENATATSEIWVADSNAPLAAAPAGGSIVTGGQSCSIICCEIRSHP